MTPPGEIHLIKFTPSFLSTFPIQVFAFTCAQNVKTTPFTILPQLLMYGQLFPVFNELKSNSQKRMNIAVGTAIGSATLTYEVIAVFGYLTFGSRVRSTCI
jgi:amino acid permease